MIKPTHYKSSLRSPRIGQYNTQRNEPKIIVTMHTNKKASIGRKHGGERILDKNMRRRQSTLQMFVAKPTEELRDLFWATEYGDYYGVEAILDQNPTIDADAADAFGRTPVQIAVVNEHAEIVELLLEKSNPVNLYEALLLAINHNYENITELILKHPAYRQFHNRWPELAAKLPETSPFSDDISPIILACQKNLFGIVHLLWQEGMRVPLPHEFDCTCERCQPEHDHPYNSRDQLKHAKRRLNEYRALTSEAYISLTSSDPFQTAFELSRQMEQRAAQEKHFKREYKELVGRLSRYVVKLLDNVRTHSELTTILNNHSITQSPMALNSSSDGTASILKESSFFTPIFNTNNTNEPPPPSYVKSEPLARLRVAIQYKQKEFVAHWSCQQELMRRWLRGFNQYQGTSGQSKIILQFILIILAYPLLLFSHWIVPDSKMGKLLSRPLVKFVIYSVSYLAFLGVLCLITVNPFGCYSDAEKLSQISTPQTLHNANATRHTLNITLYRYCKAYCHGICNNVGSIDRNSVITNVIGELPAEYVKIICSFGKDFVIRPRGDNLMSWIVSIWMFGLLLRKLFEIVTRDIPNRLNQRWAALAKSPFDVIDYVVLAVFAIAFFFRFFSYSKTASAIDFFLKERVSNASLRELTGKLYWLNADRYYFHPLDPLTCSELLFAVGAVFSFSRLLYIFPVLEVFGPCYLALMRVVNDIFAFFFVFLVVFAAFMIGTMNVYWYFNPTLRRALQLNSSYDPGIPAEERFGNIELTFRTVFWSLFGLGESDYMNLQNFANGSMIWVERIGYIMYGGYSVVVVCVLMNMLIAMMANSYETIKINSETEWKYARTILFLEYIPDYSPTVPTPFNIVPNPRYLMQALQRLYKQIRFSILRKRDASQSRTSNISESDDVNNNNNNEDVQLKCPNSAHAMENCNDEDDNRFSKTSAIGSLVSSLVSISRDVATLATPQFNDVINKIVRRFIMDLTIQGSSGTVDLEEIKQDISSFRFELFDVLSGSNFTPQSTNVNVSSRAKVQGNTNSIDQLKPPDTQELSLPSRSPLLHRRSFGPYRRRHLLASTNASLDDDEVKDNFGNGGLTMRRFGSFRLRSLKRPPLAATNGGTTFQPPLVRIDRVEEEPEEKLNDNNLSMTSK